MGRRRSTFGPKADALREANNKCQRKKQEIMLAAKDRPCADCGVKYPSYVMDFDHLDPKIKGFNIGAAGRNHTVRELLAEIAKCEVVCANCHRRRTYLRIRERIEASRNVKRAVANAPPDLNPPKMLGD